MKGRTKLLILLIIVIFFASMVGGRVSYFLLYAILFTLIIPIVHSLIGISTIKGEVSLQETVVYAGDTINIDYKIWSNSPMFFPKIVIENNIQNKLTGKKSVKETFSLYSRKAYHNNIEVICRRRGDYEIGNIKIYIGDIFNFFRFSKTISVPLNLRVYPKITQLYSLSLKAITPMGELLANNKLLQDYTEVSDLRPYEKGDNIKQIHWKASAKQENLLVKNFETKGDTNVIVILNSSAQSYMEDENNVIEDRAVESGLSIINYCLKRGIKVSLFYQKDGSIVHIKGNDILDLKSFMDSLVTFHPLETISFEEQMNKYSTINSENSISISITPTIDKNILKQGMHWKNIGLNPSYILLDCNKDKYKPIITKLREEGIQVYHLDSIEELSKGLEGYYEEGI